LKNRRFFVSSGQFYGIPNISNSIKKSKGLFEVQMVVKKRKNIFWDLVDIFINFFNYYSKGLLTFYYSSFEESPNSEEHFKKIERIFLDSDLSRTTNQFSTFSQVIKNQLDFSLGCEKFIKEIFDKDNPLFFLAHQIRWMMMPELAQFLEYKKIPIHLISHGSHSPSNDDHSLNAQKFLANGLLFSDFSNYAYCQSPFALDALGQFTSEKEVRKIFPLMWGYNYSKSKDFKYKKNNSDIFKIIYAGTFKPYCLRPTIYETSFELIKSLRALINTVDKLDGFKLTVRMRDEDECSLESLKFLLPRSNNLVFDNSGTFEEQIVRHDCLISFSSTTLEEALSHSIPVCTFTSDSNYRHLEHARSPRLIYNLSKETLKDQLISIKESIKNNFQLKSEDKKNILWTEKQAVNFLDFLSKI
jgi:hypothetical protein